MPNDKFKTEHVAADWLKNPFQIGPKSEFFFIYYLFERLDGL